MVSGVEKLACAGIVCRAEGLPLARLEVGEAPPPRVFLRKDVILWELCCEIAQECDSKGFNADRSDSAVRSEVPRGLVEAITTHDSMNC